jgi:hypothetical protein
MPPTTPDDTRAAAARRLTEMRARTRRSRNRAFAAGAASFAVALGAVLLQQHADTSRTTAAASGTVEAGKDDPSLIDAVTDAITDDGSGEDRDWADDGGDTSLDAPTTRAS